MGPDPFTAVPTSGPGRGGGLSRRQFLALAGGMGAIGAIGGLVGWPRVVDLVTPPGTAGATRPSGRTLVLVTLYGGNDGLNTVVPYEDPHYESARGLLALDPHTVLPLADGFGLHPQMTGLERLFREGRLAVVHGVGFANPNYSHFQSMDIWQSGQTDPTSSGWLGRWLDATGSDPLRAVAVGPTAPTVLTGERVQGAALPLGPLVLPGGPTEQALYRAMARTGKGEPTLASLTAASAGDLLTVNDRLGPILGRTATANPLHRPTTGTPASGEASLGIANGGGGLSSPGVLASQLSLVANLILADAPPEVYSVELGGFDTHADQTPTQDKLLSELDTAVSAFVDAMSTTARGKETIVFVYSEFGRRVAGNASAGSDHGWANVVLVAGHPVKGGFYGEPPSLTTLSEGNLVFTTDFRATYATLLDQVLGVDPRSFLGVSPRPIAFV